MPKHTLNSNEETELLAQQVFHIFNQSNDRSSIFHEDENYRYFLRKLVRLLPPAMHLIGYCLMPNHFHLLGIPKHAVRLNYPFSDKPEELMPTQEISQAIQRLLMGYTKGYNALYNKTGSRFRQKTKSVHHSAGVRVGLHYVHENPVEAGLVVHASEWGFSSFNEYEGLINQQDCICDIDLGKRLLAYGE